ncbi:ABC transporter G family member 15 [Linum perenne]
MDSPAAGGGGGESFLVWEDLTVTMGSNEGKKKKKHLINGFIGFARSGRVTAVMGPSGSGKSTFLDAISGRLPSKVSIAGRVMIKNTQTSQLIRCRDVSYVPQHDVLLGTLTVKETLRFSARLRLPELSTGELDDAIHSTIVKMGLQECAQNTVGNWHVRGISSGERKRLRIGVEIVARPPHVLCLDEPTTGLDSAASFFVVQALRNVADEGLIVLCSVHQPGNDVFRLFDDLLLVSGGETVYFGEAGLAVKFFGDCGFPCPIRRNPPDHFLRCITPEFDQVFAALKQTGRQTELADPFVNLTTAETRAALVEKYRSSSFQHTARKQIQQLTPLITVCNNNGDENPEKKKKRYWWKQFCTLTHRSFLHMTRDIGYYWLRTLFYIMVSLSVGTLEFDIGTSASSVVARGKVDAFLYGLMIFLSVGGLPFFLDEIKSFNGELVAGYYGESAYVLSNFISALPFTIAISFSSGSIMYSMVKFHHGFSHLLYFCINIFFCISVSEACVFVTASLVSNPLPSMGVAIGVTVLNLMPSNVFRPLPELPKIVWRYPLSYISFAAWGTQGNLKNDMMGLEFNAAVHGHPKTRGETILQNTYGIDLHYSKWWDIAALFCLLLSYRLLLVITLHYKQHSLPNFYRFYPVRGLKFVIQKALLMHK